jgi:hypothetical protein
MDAGKWTATPCDNKKGYICKTGNPEERNQLWPFHSAKINNGHT